MLTMRMYVCVSLCDGYLQTPCGRTASRCSQVAPFVPELLQYVDLVWAFVAAIVAVSSANTCWPHVGAQAYGLRDIQAKLLIDVILGPTYTHRPVLATFAKCCQFQCASWLDGGHHKVLDQLQDGGQLLVIENVPQEVAILSNATEIVWIPKLQGIEAECDLTNFRKY